VSAPSLGCVVGWAKEFQSNASPAGLMDTGDTSGGGLLRRLYTRVCKQKGCKPNSGLLNTFDSLTPPEQLALNSIDLSRNFMGSNGVYAILEFVSIQTTLEHVDLSYNNVELEHIVAMEAIVGGHNCLKSLNLSGNPLTVVAARIIIKMLVANERLTFVGVDDTSIDDEWCERIATYCARNAERQRAIADAAAALRDAPQSSESSTTVTRPLGHWKYVRVYISSTQVDFQEELSVVQKVVFPKLNELTNSLYLRFIPVVLSWDCSKGVTQAMLRSSFEAIDGCREPCNGHLPWLIVFTGERIGEAPEELPQPGSFRNHQYYKWLEKDQLDKVAKMSLPQLEVWHAFLAQYGTRTKSELTPTVFVYRRDGSAMQDLTREQEALYHCEKAGETLELPGLMPGDPPIETRYEYRRARLFEQMELCAVARTCTYIPILSPDGKLGGLESLAVKASTDMWAAAKALYSDVAEEKGALYKPSKMLQPSPDLFFPMGPHRYTASQQEAFLNWKSSHCVGRESPLKALEDYCSMSVADAGLEATFPLLVFGATGSGKSTLLAEFCKNFVQSGRDATLVYFFVGGSKNSTYISDVLFQLYVQLFPAIHEGRPVTWHSIGGLSNLPKLIAELLQQPPLKPLVLVVDGIDDIEYMSSEAADGKPRAFSPSEAALSWVPHSFHQKVRVILSSGTLSPSLKMLRQRVPQPFEMALSALGTAKCMAILRRYLTPVELPGLGKDTEALTTHLQEGVVDGPASAVSALMYKDESTVPMFHVLVAELFRSVLGSLNTELDVMRFITEHVPETVPEIFKLLLSEWEAEFGLDCVANTLSMLVVQREGTPEDELITLCSEILPWHDSDKKDNFHKFYSRLEPLLYTGPSGLVQLNTQAIVPVVEDRYNLRGDKVAAFHAAFGRYYQECIANKTYNYLRALEQLPGQLVRAGALDAAYRVLMSPVFMELKVQCGLHWQLVRDFELLLREIRRSRFFPEEGSSPNQTSVFRRRHHLRGSVHQYNASTYTDVLLQYSNVLAHYPSVCQVGINVAESHALCIDVERMVAENTVPYILLRQRNKCKLDLRATHTLRGHKAGVLHAHYSPDGTALVSTPRSGHVCVWDTTTGTLLHELAYHDPEAPFGSPGPSWVSTNYSPSGEQLICVAHDQMTWWDALTAQQRVTIRGHVSSLTTSCFSSTGKSLATVSMEEHKVVIVDVAKAKHLSFLPPPAAKEWINEVVFSAKDDAVLTCLENAVHVTQPHGNISYKLHKGPVSQITTSPKSTLVATVCENAIHVWNLRTGDVVQVLEGHADRVTAVSFSHDDKRLVSGSEDGTVRVWTLHDGKLLETLDAAPDVYTDDDDRITRLRRPTTTQGKGFVGVGPTEERHRVGWCSFTPGREHIVARVGCTVKVWDAVTYRTINTLHGHNDTVHWMALCPTANAIATASEDHTVRLWDLEGPLDQSLRTTTPNLLLSTRAHTMGVNSIDIASDGSRLVTTGLDGILKVWDLRTDGGDLVLSVGGGYSMARFLDTEERDPQSIVVGRIDTVVVLDLKTGQQLCALPVLVPSLAVVQDEEAGIRLLEAAPDGSAVALVLSSKSEDLSRKIFVLSLPKGQHIAAFNSRRARIASIRFLTPQIVLATGMDGVVRSYWIPTRQEMDDLVKFDAPASCVAAASDGSFIVSGSQDTTLQVTDVKSKKCRVTLVGHVGRVKCTATSSSGKYVASGADDLSVKLWTADDGRCVASFMCKAVPTVLAFTPAQSSGPLKGAPEMVIVGDDAGHTYVFDVLD